MKLNRSVYAIGLLILMSGFSQMANAQPGMSGQRRYETPQRWQYLGQSRVDGRRDHDVIRVNTRGGFRAIQLRAQGAEIEFQRVVVRFENGANSEVEIRDRIKSGGQTRAIDLPGDDRRIQSIEVWYGQNNWGRRRPTLTLYGRR